MATPARKRDYRAQIQAILLHLGEKEGLKYKDGRPKALGYERLAEIVGRSHQAVKKWFQSDWQVPERESIIALNKVAPEHLRIRLDEEQPSQPQQSNGDSDATRSIEEAILDWLNKPDRPSINRDELARIQNALDIIQGKRRP